MINNPFTMLRVSAISIFKTMLFSRFCIVVILVTNCFSFANGQQQPRVVEVCTPQWIALTCPQNTHITVLQVWLAESSCSDPNCCPRSNDCTHSPYDGKQNIIPNACNGRTSCRVQTFRQKTPCHWSAFWVNNDYIRIQYNCIDVDECRGPNRGGCSERATCSNTFGSYRCECIDGYSGNGFTCEDNNECVQPNRGGCHVNATCDNTQGSHTCTCDAGFNGDGYSCHDINDCSQPDEDSCHQNANWTCINGEHNCTCNEGFEGDGHQCQDIDECRELDPASHCSPLATCTNSIGSYACTCNDGYVGDGFTCTAVETSLATTVDSVVTSIPISTLLMSVVTTDTQSGKHDVRISSTFGDVIKPVEVKARAEEHTDANAPMTPTQFMIATVSVLSLFLILIVVILFLWYRLRYQRRRRRDSEKQLQMTLRVQRNADCGFRVEYHSNVDSTRPMAVVQGTSANETDDLAAEIQPFTGTDCSSSATAGACSAEGTTAVASADQTCCKPEKVTDVCASISERRLTATANQYEKLDCTSTGRGRSAPATRFDDGAGMLLSTGDVADATVSSTADVYSVQMAWYEVDEGKDEEDGPFKHQENFYEDIEGLKQDNDDNESQSSST